MAKRISRTPQAPLWRKSVVDAGVSMLKEAPFSPSENAVRRRYLGGSLTMLSQKPSIILTISVNCSQSTGFVM